MVSNESALIGVYHRRGYLAECFEDWKFLFEDEDDDDDDRTGYGDGLLTDISSGCLVAIHTQSHSPVAAHELDGVGISGRDL